MSHRHEHGEGMYNLTSRYTTVKNEREREREREREKEREREIERDRERRKTGKEGRKKEKKE